MELFSFIIQVISDTNIHLSKITLKLKKLHSFHQLGLNERQLSTFQIKI